jgi:hypothetical protein
MYGIAVLPNRGKAYFRRPALAYNKTQFVAFFTAVELAVKGDGYGKAVAANAVIGEFHKQIVVVIVLGFDKDKAVIKVGKCLVPYASAHHFYQESLIIHPVVCYTIPMPKANEPHDLYDLAFKRLMHLSSTAVVSFINGIFDAKHPVTSTVEYASTEDVSGKLQRTHKDMVIVINNDRYILEMQRHDDKMMAHRIFIYSYNDALMTKSTDKHGIITLDFPHAVVIYLENTGRTHETLRLRFPDQTEHTFTVPVFNLLDHTIADLERHNLQLLLPFYVLKLHERVKQAKTGDERRLITPELIALIKEIETATDAAITKGSLHLDDTRIIIELLDRVYNHLYKPYNELQEANKLAEQVLVLRTDKIVREARLREERIKREAEQVLALRMDKVVREAERIKREAELHAREAEVRLQEAEQEKQGIADNLRKLGLTDEQIQSVMNVQLK